MRFLIVNGDDFGMSTGVNRGIMEAHRRGILTSTSLMVRRPAAEEAARLARQVPDLSIGLHLELNDATDTDPGAAEHQLLVFERLIGHPPTHLDSHHDRHHDPGVLPLVLEAAQRLGIPLRGHSPARCVTKFYGQWAGETHVEQVSVASLIRILETEITVGVTELICHPGYPHALESSYTSVREAEIRTLCHPRVAQVLLREGIRLVGFRDVAGLLTATADPNPRPSWPP